MRKLPPHLWLVITLLVLGVVASVSSCLRPQWMGCSSKLLEGMTAGENTTRKQEMTLTADAADQARTINNLLEDNKDVTLDQLRYYLQSQDALDNHIQEYEPYRITLIKNKVKRGETITQKEIDTLKNNVYAAGRDRSRDRATRRYLDEYSIDDYSRTYTQPFERDSRHSLRPSRNEMRRGGTLDSSFTRSFQSGSPLLGDTHLSSHASPQSYMIGGGVPYQTTTKPSLNLPTHNDPYALEGISRSQIPAGEEDKYILKSKIVPPVCPACPNVCPKEKGECPPCPPCERCPDPDVQCRKVTNYAGAKKSTTPMPILTDFSKFDI